jgi:hypothetical protein
MGAYNRRGKHRSFSFLNLDYAEKDEEDEKKHFKFIFFIFFSVIQVQKIYKTTFSPHPFGYAHHAYFIIIQK